MKKIFGFTILLAMIISSISIVSAVSETTEYKIGDVNKDGIINVKDAVIVQRNIVNKNNFSSEDLYISDVNGDGVITVADATLIQKYASKIVLDFTKEPETTTVTSTTVSTTQPITTTKPTLTTDPDGYFDIVVKP